jgi:hypothetical protein
MDTQRLPLLGTLVALALAGTAPAFAQSQDPEDALLLEPLTVTAPVAPLDRSLHLLRLLVAQSTPCLGCDAAPVRSNALLDYLLASEPPAVSETDLLLLDLKVKDSPELEFLRP